MRLFSSRKRPVHLGPYPMERMPRTVDRDSAVRPPTTSARILLSSAATGSFAEIAVSYLRLFDDLRQGPVASERAPLPDDAAALTNELKAACYFLDAAMVGCCRVPEFARFGPHQDEATSENHTHALVVMTGYGREPESDNLACSWVAESRRHQSALRSAEIACVVAGYIRRLGFPAVAHTLTTSAVHHEILAIESGLAWRNGDEVVNPFLGTGFVTAIVTTAMPLCPDSPLAPPSGSLGGMLRQVAFFFGVGGTRSGLQLRLERRRRSDLGTHPMEKIKRVDQPTTLILEDEVPRVPKRAEFFQRALRGDLGERTQRERHRFAIKHPLANAMAPLIGALVPLQDGEVADAVDRGTSDPRANTSAIRSLAHHLDADMVGICEAKAYTWYSHDRAGKSVVPSHRYAIVMVIDQGQDTMDGASGDDWISGSQSIRAYLRGAEIAGLLAAQIRALGHSARSHTNADSQVLHIPLVLLAGLGELSRIGELVLNPFLGARFKTVVVTTDMPLDIDRPIDFGLQDMCGKCRKCARECPVNAISHRDKVMFNGYEMWKPDVERCARYRVTNTKGSACGRCMKMCPFTNEGLLAHRFFLWLAIKAPLIRRWIPLLDDLVRNGSRNPVKKWWHDLEWLPRGVAVRPMAVNQRDLNPKKGRKLPQTQEIAYYTAAAMPAPDADGAVPIDRKAALRAAQTMETPMDALLRTRRR